MKQIKKHFATIKQAENFLSKLYCKYDKVQLIQFPVFSENGIYIYSVK